MKQYFKLLLIAIIVINTNHIAAQRLNLEYSTFLGGSSDDRAHGMAIDKQGNIYLTAPIQSTDFPITANALNSNPSGIYLAKISAGGDSLIFSTFIGAGGGANYAHGVAVDDKGYIYIAGNTTNPDFPTTEKAFDRTFNGPADASHGDAFVMKLNPEGNKIIYSTFIGGSGMEISGKITVDAEGNAYVIGSTSSKDFPVTSDAYDTSFNGGSNDGRDDIFVLKLNASGSELLYCTYIGGSNTELYGNNILIDNIGTVYFAATTSSSNFPITANAFDKTYNGGSGTRGAGDGVIIILNPEGKALEYSTFFGGSGDDFAYGLSRNEKNGKIYICGGTSSSDIPLTTDAFAKTIKSGYFAEFSNDATKLLYSTYWNASIQTIVVHKSGNIIISGSTESTDFPVTPEALDTTANGSGDIYISIFNPDKNALLYSTYFGGKNNDILSALLIDNNSIIICGNKASSDFPVSEMAYDITFNGGTNQWGGDAYISKFDLNLHTEYHYLGQTPPGDEPVIFAPGIVSINGRYEYGLSISPDGNEIFYTADSPGEGLSVIKKVNGQWSKPQTANMRGNNSWEFEAFYSIDGQKLFFTSDTNKESKFWFTNKNGNSWSRPELLNSPVNNTPVMWCTFAADGTMYYGNNDNLKIHRAKFTNGKYSSVENLEYNGTHPSVAPDESYFLFNSSKYGGYGKSDILVVFKKENNTWSDPINLGDKINTSYGETCASLSPDGKYIFFSRYDEPEGKCNIYWVSSSVIDSLKSNISNW